MRRTHELLAAVVGDVEADAHCRDIGHQLATVTTALNRAGFLVIATALQQHLSRPEAAGGAEQDEVEKLLLTLA